MRFTKTVLALSVFPALTTTIATTPSSATTTPSLATRKLVKPRRTGVDTKKIAASIIAGDAEKEVTLKNKKKKELLRQL